jgi:spermidine synthase
MLVLALPGSLSYSNEGLRNLNSCVLHTLRGVFSHIRVLPGDGTNLLLASDSQAILAIDRMQVLERANQRGLQADVSLPWTIERKLHPGWQEWFSSFVEGGSERINSDLNPVGLFYSISQWNALFAPSLRWLFRQFEKMSMGIVVLLFAVPLLPFLLLRSKGGRFFRASIPLSIVTTGFAGMILDLMLIFTFQSIHGYVFAWIGLLVASFMAGAACGAALIAAVLARISDSYKLFAELDLAIVCYAVGCPLVLLAGHRHLGNPGALLGRMLFLVACFIGGLLIGSQFPLANRIYTGAGEGLSSTAGLLYAADLLGGWLGGVVGAVVLLPVLGLVGTGIAVGLVKLTSFIVLSTQPCRHL